MLYLLISFAAAYVVYVLFGNRLAGWIRRVWLGRRPMEGPEIPRDLGSGSSSPHTAEPVSSDETTDGERIPRDLGRGFNKPLSGEPVPRDETTDAEIRSLLESTVRDAIFLCRNYPPAHDMRNLSYFGGLPTLPAGVEWPTFDPSPWASWKAPTPIPMHLLAQIDCGALPQFSGRELLPEHGILFFFAQTDLVGVGEPRADMPETKAMACVLYHDGETDGLQERQAPDSLPICYGGECAYYFGWLGGDDNDEAPRCYTNWPIKPVPVRTYDDRHPTKPDAPVAGRYQELWEVAQRESYIKAFGDPVMSTRWPEKTGPGLWFPDDAFPYSWNCIDSFARHLRKQLNDPVLRERITEIEDLNGRRVLFAGEDYCDKVLAQVATLIGQAAGAGGFAPVPEDQRLALRTWCVDLATPDPITGECIGGRYLDQILYDAFNKSVADCLTHSAEAAALIPNTAIAVARPQHAAFRHGAFSGMVRHQIMGPPIVTQPDWREFDDVLLLQLDSDDGMNWLWSSDCGAYQFWIKRDDLIARRFDRVRPHIEN